MFDCYIGILLYCTVHHLLGLLQEAIVYVERYFYDLDSEVLRDLILLITEEIAKRKPQKSHIHNLSLNNTLTSLCESSHQSTHLDV